MNYHRLPNDNPSVLNIPFKEIYSKWPVAVFYGVGCSVLRGHFLPGIGNEESLEDYDDLVQ
jgi:hypothetical protein